MAEELKLEQPGALSGIARTQVFGLPVGAAAGGAVIAGLFDSLSGIVAGMAPGIPSWAVKGIGAWAAAQWGPKTLGREISDVAALLLTYDAVQEFMNLRGLLSGVFKGVKLGAAAPAAPSIIEQAGATASQAWDAIK